MSAAIVLLVAGVLAAGAVTASSPRAAAPAATTTPPTKASPLSTTTSPATTTTTTVSPQVGPPQADDVVAGRFVRSAGLDNGELVISPAPAADQPAIDLGSASTLFRSNGAVTSSAPVVLGFGLVSVDPAVNAGHGTAPLRATPAWIGVVHSAGIYSCPAIVATTSVPAGPPPPTPNYTAVIIPAAPAPIVSYRSRSQVCDEPPTGPTLSATPQVVSAPWQEVGLVAGQLTLRYQAPSCVADPELGVSAGGNVRTGDDTVTVELAIPYGTTCPLTWRTDTVSLAPDAPGAPPQPTTYQLSHGPTGPVDVTSNSPPD